MKLSIDLGSWTTTKAALAVGGLLLAVGTALAISPTLQAPIKWQGGWEYTRSFPISGSFDVISTLPAGRNLLMTDITLGNFGTEVAEVDLVTGLGDCSTPRLQNVLVAPKTTVHLTYETGIGIPAGHQICVTSFSAVSVSMPAASSSSQRRRAKTASAPLPAGGARCQQPELWRENLALRLIGVRFPTAEQCVDVVF